MSEDKIVGGVVQNFYDSMASSYDMFYEDWEAASRQEADFLERIFLENGLGRDRTILDCACGIGTQALGLAALGYDVTGSDISSGELAEASRRAEQNSAGITLVQADFRELEKTFTETFDIVIAMDNALPHMLTKEDLDRALRSIAGRTKEGGIFVASIRDYDRMLREKPNYSAPYVHRTEHGQRVLFQTWEWIGDNYRFIQYIINDEEGTTLSRFECEYRADRRRELTEMLCDAGFGRVSWMMPEETGFYQPVFVAGKI